MTLMISPRWFQWPSGSRANGLEFDRDGAAVAHGGSMSLVQESPKLLRVLVVAPDLGAVKLAREYARLLHLPMAIVHKTRLDGEAVESKAVVGAVSTAVSH